MVISDILLLYKTGEPADMNLSQGFQALCFLLTLDGSCDLWGFAAGSLRISPVGTTSVEGDNIDGEYLIHGEASGRRKTPWTAQVIAITLKMVTCVSGHQWHQRLSATRIEQEIGKMGTF